MSSTSVACARGMTRQWPRVAGAMSRNVIVQLVLGHARAPGSRPRRCGRRCSRPWREPTARPRRRPDHDDGPAPRDGTVARGWWSCRAYRSGVVVVVPVSGVVGAGVVSGAVESGAGAGWPEPPDGPPEPSSGQSRPSPSASERLARSRGGGAGGRRARRRRGRGGRVGRRGRRGRRGGGIGRRRVGAVRARRRVGDGAADEHGGRGQDGDRLAGASHGSLHLLWWSTGPSQPAARKTTATAV